MGRAYQGLNKGNKISFVYKVVAVKHFYNLNVRIPLFSITKRGINITFKACSPAIHKKKQ